MTIVIAGIKGGICKSTTALNLAVTLGATIIDLDYQRSCTTASLMRDEKLEPLRIAHSLSALSTIKGDVVIDTGAGNKSEFREAMKLADIIIIPTSSSAPDILAMPALIPILESVNPTADIYTLITNTSRPRDEGKRRAKIADIRAMLCALEWKHDVLETIIPRSPVYEKCFGRGIGISELKRKVTADDPAHPAVHIMELAKFLKAIEKLPEKSYRRQS